ncbi:MAG: hypothetical protein ABI691_21270 [Ginsengibacter sp.]
MQIIARFCFLISLLLTFFTSSSQVPAGSEKLQMNFMTGTWDLFTSGSLIGNSIVDTILNNHVIEETFTELPPEPFLGKSWITYNEYTQHWEMTQVDNQGNHSFFTGSFKDNKVIFERNFKNRKGEDRIHRLTYYNISGTAFDWTFDTSSDKGKTWTVYYNVHYARKA